MCKGGGGTNTVQTNSQPPPEIMAAYREALGRADQVSWLPRQTYQGQTVAQFTGDQKNAMQLIRDAQGRATPYIDRASALYDQASRPLYETVGNYLSPYVNDVVNATQGQFNNNNAIQQAGIVGNAAAQGAWGGDRSAVAQGIVAGQQQQAQAPVIAGLYNQGYQTALNADEAQSWIDSNTAQGLSGLGAEALNTSLTGAQALWGAGTQQQQLDQANLNVPYYNFLADQAYPFQTAQYFANIAEGIGGNAGGTSSTRTPAASSASQLFGTGLGALGLIGGTQGFGAGGWLTSLLALKDGGRIPGHAPGGAVSDPFSFGALPYQAPPITGGVPNVGISIIPPQANTLTHGMGPPKPPQGIAPGAQLPGSPDLSMGGISGMLKSSGAFGQNGWLGGGGQSGIMSGQFAPGITDWASPSTGDFGGFRRGGIVGFDTGGDVDPMTSADIPLASAPIVERRSLPPLIRYPLPSGAEELEPVATGVNGVPARQPEPDTPYVVDISPKPQGRGIARPQPAYTETDSDQGDIPPQPSGIVPLSANTAPVGGGIAPSATPSSPTPSGSRISPQDAWLALAAAGFGMAAGRSPQALQNIGSGALEGLKFLQSERAAGPEYRLKGAQADKAEAEVANIKAMRDYYAGKSSNPAPVADQIDKNIAAAKGSIADGETTQAMPVPGGAVAPHAGPQNPAPVTSGNALPPPSAEERQVSAQVQTQIRTIDAQIAEQQNLMRFVTTPEAAAARQQAISNLIVRRSEMLKEDPLYQRTSAYSKASGENPALIGRAAGEAAAKLPYQVETGRPGSYILRGGQPVGAVPERQNIADPVTGEKSQTWVTPPLPGTQPGVPGVAAQGNPPPVVTELGPAQQHELQHRGEAAVKEREHTLQDAQSAQTQQATLAQMSEDADHFYQGPFSESIGEAQRFLRLINPAYDVPVTSRESFVKNAGALTRQATREVSSRAAYQEVQFIQNTLPNPEMSPKGIRQVIGEYAGLNDYKIAKARALAGWEGQHNGSTQGFEDFWQAQAPVTPYTFVISRLAPPDRQALFTKWGATPEGRAELQRIRAQMTYATQAGLLP